MVSRMEVGVFVKMERMVSDYRILYRITCIHHSPRHYKMTLTIMFIITK